MINPHTFQLPDIQLPAETSALLFTQWVTTLSSDRLGLAQNGASSTADGTHIYSFGSESADHFKLEASNAWSEWRLTSIGGLNNEAVIAVIDDALAKTAAQDFGGDVVYEIGMQTAPNDIGSNLNLQFERVLGDQVRIVGWRRLSDSVLLDFSEEDSGVPGAPMLFAPRTKIRALIIVPAPSPGDLSNQVAGAHAEMVAAICTLALGRVTIPEFGAMMFPASDEVTEEARSLRHEGSILTLARDGVSLDIFGDLGALSGVDGILRARGALLSYHAALAQTNADIATMLFVSAIEALIAPRLEWGKEKVTKRFIKGVRSLCPQAVDNLIAHPNIEMALQLRLKGSPSRRRYDVLDGIYAMRSVPTHMGIGLSRNAMLLALGSSENMRVALLSDLARAAILGFLQAPRSFLIGHPLLDPPAEPPTTR